MKYLLIPMLLGLLTQGASAIEVKRAQFLMGTLCEITVHAKSEVHGYDTMTAAFSQISAIEKKLSTYIEESEVSRINRLASSAPQKSTPLVYDLLVQASTYHTISKSAFDVTKGYHSDLLINPIHRTVFFKNPHMALDFGGIGKGYALDKAADILKENGISSALLNFGGLILALNPPPHKKEWIIHIAHPIKPHQISKGIPIKNQALSTSSQQERPGHIIDPRTKQPADFQGSVTVLAETATKADVLSTALAVLGPDHDLVIEPAPIFISTNKEIQ